MSARRTVNGARTESKTVQSACSPKPLYQSPFYSVALELPRLNSSPPFRAGIDQRAGGAFRPAGVADAPAVADQQNMEFQHMPCRNQSGEQIVRFLG